MGKFYIYNVPDDHKSKLPKTWSFATKKAHIEALLKTRFSSRTCIKIDQMVKVNESLDYGELIELVHLFLGANAIDSDYPVDCFFDLYGTPVKTKTQHVGSILSQIVYFLKRASSFAGHHLAQDLMLSSAASLDHQSKETIDFLFTLGERKDLLPVEVDKYSAEGAKEQCLLAMHLMYQKNGNNQTVYGVCTNSKEWIVYSWDGKKIVRSYEMSLTKTDRQEDGLTEEKLKENIAVVLKVIVSILVSQFDVGEAASQTVQQRSAIEVETMACASGSNHLLAKQQVTERVTRS